MLKTFASLAVFALLLPGTLAQAQGGKLQRVREAVQPPEIEESDKDEEPCCCDDAIELDPVSAYIFLMAAASPFVVPAELMGDTYAYAGYFVRYPYADGYPGSMWIDRAFEVGPGTPVKNWRGHVSLENGDDFDGLNRTNGRLLLETSSRFGLQTSWNYFHENLATGADNLTLGDVNFVFRFAQNEWMQMRTGLGVRVLADDSGSDVGFNLTYGADITCRKPFVSSLTLDAGSVGDAGLFHFRGTLGVLLQRWELFGGYDFFRIGTTNLQGPMAGLRLWF